jgi:hypothetical protein
VARIQGTPLAEFDILSDIGSGCANAFAAQSGLNSVLALYFCDSAIVLDPGAEVWRQGFIRRRYIFRNPLSIFDTSSCVG